MSRLTYLGPRFSYSEKAAMKLASQIKIGLEVLPLVSAQAVAYSLVSKDREKADFAVLPYYNFLDGLVQECLDLIYENRLFIIGSQRIPIELSLGQPPNAETDHTIYSHPKALAQCSEYLWQNYPKFRQVATSSTSGAAKLVGNEGKGLAISAKDALLNYGLEIVGENVGNKRHGKTNFTDFYVLATTDNDSYDPDLNYFTMIAVTPHMDRAGLLSEILGQIAFYGLNNAKIHSRPAIDEVLTDVEPQMFYLEIMAHKKNENFKRCIDSLKYRLAPKGKNVEVVRVLGSYPRP